MSEDPAHHDVFISYSREDRPRVKVIADALAARGLHVWWDPKIQTGHGFRQEITEALTNTNSVIVVWSRHSVSSRFVCDEADEGAARDILFPALIDNVDIPLGFRQIQTADLTHWNGHPDDPALKAFVEAVAAGGSLAREQDDPEPEETEPEEERAPEAEKPKKKPPAKKPAKPAAKSAYMTTGAKRRLHLFAQAVFLALAVAAAFGVLAYASDFVFDAYRPVFIAAMGALAFLSRYATLEADRAAGAASLALLPRSYIALVLFSLIAIAPLVLEGRIYAAALEGVQVKGIEGADINSVTLHRDGRRLLTASDDSTVKLWDAETGAETNEYKDHEHWVWGADFSPDGQYAVSASRDRTARIWETATAKTVRVLDGHGASVYDVAWHPTGETIATASGDGVIRLWDPETGEIIRTLIGHNGRVSALDFHLSGDILASASEDATVGLWNWRTGARIASLAVGAPVNDVKFSKDGARFAAAADGGRARVWSTANRAVIGDIDHGAERAFAVAFVNDDETLATSGVDAAIRFWDVASQQPAGELTGHRDGVRGLDSSLDGAMLVSGSRDNTARIWDVETRRVLQTVGHIDSAIDLPVALDLPPLFIASQAPAPVDFAGRPGKAVSLAVKGTAAAVGALLIGLFLKLALWLAGARGFARRMVVGALALAAIYIAALIASALPAEALALWATLAFVPATIFAALRWLWRQTILRRLNRRTRPARAG